MTLHEINIDILVTNKLGTNRDLSLKDSRMIREFKPRRRHDWHENQALYQFATKNNYIHEIRNTQNNYYRIEHV